VHEVEGLGRRGLAAGERGALVAPLRLHHLGQAVDDDVQERADAQPGDRHDEVEGQRVSLEGFEEIHRLQ
jgi:hypothetical protein